MMLNFWRSWLEERVKPQLRDLEQVIDSQEEFAKTVHDMLDALELTSDDDDLDDLEDDEQQGDQSTEEESGDSEEGDDETDGATMSEGTETDAEGDVDDSALGMDEEMLADGEDPAGPTDGETDLQKFGRAGGPPYHAYSTTNDETVDAHALCEPMELDRLRSQLDQQLAQLHSVVSRLAKPLTKTLACQNKNRSWEFDLEEGILNVARLPRIIIDPFYPLSFKVETEIDFSRHCRPHY